MKKALSVLIAVLLLMTAFPTAVFAAEEEIAVTLINQDGAYTIDSESNQPVDIDGANATVTLSDASIQNQNRSAIRVKGNSNVTFVLEGFSTIKGSDNTYSCGIEVEYGSSVTFEGEGTLNVTGGKYGAAIGSYGTGINIPEEERVQVGEITINSGNINAYGGDRGAGIGAGYHVSGNLITINGGTVRAYAGAQGAGIGCGYGTSGGAIGTAAVGEYTAGTIIINGGDIYAASSWTDFSDFSSFEAINANEVAGAWGVGIGGGYGASVDLIEINGGKVVAVSGASGAAIGTGRGTSKGNQYNANAYHCNIRIGGDADVTAVTSDVTKDGDHLGGAAIGTGRGCHTGGTIEITGNAKVTAINAGNSPAIGSSKKNSPVDGAIPAAESIIIGDNVDLFAVSAADYAVDKDAASLSISDTYFGSTDRWFFGEQAVAISDVTGAKAESTKGNLSYSVPVGAVSLWARIAPAQATADNENPGAPVKTTSIGIVTPLAMAVRFEDGSIYYSGDTIDFEVGKDYHFQMCCVDWSTRDTNGEKKIHKPYETFYPEGTASQHVNHGIYSDDGIGLAGTVVYTVRVSERYDERSFDEATKTFILPYGDRVLRTDVNKCFMAYRFSFKGEDYNKQTGIDNVVYDTGKQHVNTLEDFRYNLPLESLSVNLPLGSTITAKAYDNYVYIGEADILITIDEANPDLCYKDYVWDF